MATFIIAPDFGVAANMRPRVRVSRFGDGYEQRVADGLNAIDMSWDLTFSARTDDEALEITDFLEARGGLEAFDWIPSGQTGSVKVVCREWRRSLDRYNLNTVTAKFERVYE